MMKTTPDQAAVAALATAALWESPRKFPIDGNWSQPEQLAYEALGLQGWDYTDEEMDIAVQVSEAAFLLGLHVWARIGADPSHVPNVTDIIAQYRVNWTKKKKRAE